MTYFSAAILIVSTFSSLPDTPLKAGKTEKFPKPFSHGLTVKLKRGTVVFAKSSHIFSASELASLRLSLDLQTPLNATRLVRSLGKQRAFSLDFAIF